MVDGAAGKGDRYRKVDQERYRENYEAIFGKDQKDGNAKRSETGKQKRTEGRTKGRKKTEE